jgi:hypothetical protein
VRRTFFVRVRAAASWYGFLVTSTGHSAVGSDCYTGRTSGKLSVLGKILVLCRNYSYSPDFGKLLVTVE